MNTGVQSNNVLVEIAPLWILPLDQIQLPMPLPFFDRFFSDNRRFPTCGSLRDIIYWIPVFTGTTKEIFNELLVSFDTGILNDFTQTSQLGFHLGCKVPRCAADRLYARV